MEGSFSTGQSPQRAVVAVKEEEEEEEEVSSWLRNFQLCSKLTGPLQ
jgi:hypothetical protein